MPETFRKEIAREILRLSGIEVTLPPEKEREGQEEEISEKSRLLRELMEELEGCRLCGLHAERTNLVFGVGNPDARLMFIGEAPGAEEDRQGEPFVGAAGKRLNVWIEYLGLRREEVYIANILKCRPPGNRTPRPDEAAFCVPFLRRQIEIISPSIIVTLGAPAFKYLLERSDGITKVRGQEFSYRGIPVIPTYHPAYILRSPAREREVYLDLDKVREILRRLP
ncbi:MAG: uracil-DNA glycosylase [Deltaproteobacteria bacterium]|nr:MAG: uracil-DNA glycosylase [Deltaproteobacteria bacterium]